MRRVEDITELWGTRVSPSTVSELNKKIYGTIEACAADRRRSSLRKVRRLKFKKKPAKPIELKQRRTSR